MPQPNRRPSKDAQPEQQPVPNPQLTTVQRAQRWLDTHAVNRMKDKEMENLSPRDADRGTGRTTKQILAAIEHAKAVNKDQTVLPIVYYVNLNRFGAEQVFNLVNKLGKEPKYYNARGEMIVDGVRVIFKSAHDRGFNSMRGSRAPIYIDHAVHEHGWGSEDTRREFYGTFLSRIVNP